MDSLVETTSRPAPATITARRPGRPRDTTVDANILRAAVELLVEADDPDDITVAAIVERATTSKAALYRRWVSREALFAAALDTVRDPVTFEATGAPIDDVLAFFSRQRRTDARFENLLMKRQLLMLRNKEMRRIYQDEFMAQRRRALRDGMESMRRAGQLVDAVDIAALVDLVYGVHYLHYLVVPGRPDAGDRTRAAVVMAMTPYLR